MRTLLRARHGISGSAAATGGYLAAQGGVGGVPDDFTVETQAAQALTQGLYTPAAAFALANLPRLDEVTLEEMADTLDRASDTMTALLASIAGVSLVVGGIGIMNVMLVSVTERTREIGLRMATGARSSDVALQFVLEAVTLSLIGGAVGLLLGLFSAWLVGWFLGWPASVSLSSMALAIGIAATVGLVFGSYPARRALIPSTPCARNEAMKHGIAGVLPALLLGVSFVLSACGPESPDQRLDRVAAQYINYAMHLDRLRPGEIDAWFGPERLDTRGSPSDTSFDAIADAAAVLREELADETSERGAALRHRIAELEAVAAFLADPGGLSFSEQTSALYDVAWPEASGSDIDTSLAAIDTELSGRGSVRARMASLRRRLVIPAEKRQAVFETALAECRRRTLANWALTPEEGIDLVWTRDVDAAWHSFDGNGRSTLQVNPLAIATIDQPLEVACHETYPGHHAQFVVFEAAAGTAGLPLEDRLVLLRSPVSALREAAAVNAVDLAFPGEERLRFERDVLFPLAGLDAADADLLHRLRPLLKRVAQAIPLIIQEHEDRELSDAEAINRLQSEALVASPRALFAFAHEVGALVAGYTILNAELAFRLDQTDDKAESDPWSQLRAWLENPETWRSGS